MREMICKVCGGTIVGDGYTSSLHCEFVDAPLDREPDASILYCQEVEQ